MFLLLAIARGLGEAARQIGFPPILGEIAAGVLLGQALLGALAPELQAAIFPSAGPLAISSLPVIARTLRDLNVFRSGSSRLETPDHAVRGVARPHHLAASRSRTRRPSAGRCGADAGSLRGGTSGA